MTMNASAPTNFTDENIANFLQDNPDFLTRHPHLMETLSLPAPDQGENIVDFQHLMVTKLRQDKKRAEDRQRLLVDSARMNMTVQARVHAAVIRLVEAQNLEELAEIVNTELALMLDVDVIAMCLESTISLEAANTNFIRTLPYGQINELMGDRDALLQTNINGGEILFGPAARLVKSQALLRLTIAEGSSDGLLAFGSRDPLLFADSQGTELVSFLGDVTERLLRRFVS